MNYLKRKRLRENKRAWFYFCSAACQTVRNIPQHIRRLIEEGKISGEKVDRIYDKKIKKGKRICDILSQSFGKCSQTNVISFKKDKINYEKFFSSFFF